MPDVTTTINGITYGLYGTLTNAPVSGSTDITPNMTGPTMGQWSCSGSPAHTEGSIAGDPYKALTSGNAATWQDRYCSAVAASPSAPITWTLISTTPFTLSAFHMLCRPDANTLQPTEFKILGDNVVLYDTGSSPLSWSAGEEKTFAFPQVTISRIDVVTTACGVLCSFKARMFS